MKIELSIDTTEPLTAHDKTIILAVAGETVPVLEAKAEPTEAEPTKAEPTKAPPAKKTAPAKKATPAKKEPEPEPVVEETEEEDLVGSSEPTMEDAVARATELISAGKTVQVKAALETAGAKRVSELDSDGIVKFLAELG